MGTIPLQAKTTVLANEKTWIEGSAIEQLQHSARLPGMQQVVGMPDLHPGRGYPVGAAFFSTGCFYPALVGNDIGCGMAFWQTGLSVNKATPAKLAQSIGDLDLPLSEKWQDRVVEFFPDGVPFVAALGTIGGGNHFAELQQVDVVYDQALLPAWLEKTQLQLLVHSGSRGLGQKILSEHITHFNHQGLSEATPEACDYLRQQDNALRFARINRQLIGERLLANLRSEGQRVLDSHHNFVEAARIAGLSGWLHRKGAIPSDQGLVVIPGSRGDYSYLLRPLMEQGEPVLYSLAHGAGRKWQRSDCKGRLEQRFRYEDLAKTTLGSIVVCADKTLLYEEAPQAYKSIENVIEVLAQAGLIEPVARLKPVLTYKTRGKRQASENKSRKRGRA